MKNWPNKRISRPIKLGVMVSAGMLSMVILLTNSITANAAIKCRGQFQVIKGIGEHVTPYCEDNYVASIARSTYGWRVSNRAVRQNPELKSRICRQIGHDYRLYAICENDRPGGRGGS